MNTKRDAHELLALPPAFYLSFIFVISLPHCTDQTFGDFLATDFPPEVSECSFFDDLNQPGQMVRSSKDGEPWVICIGEQLSLIGTDSYPLTDNYILAEDLDLAGEEFSPIGDESRAFTGTFDGNGRRITNFQIPAGADAILGYLPLGSHDENAVFTNISGAMTPQQVCTQLAPRPPVAAPILMNPHEEGGGNRLICQEDQLSDTNAYIRSNLGGRYLVGKDITFPDPAPGSGNFTLIGTSATPFQGAFSLGGKSISNLRVEASAASITDRPIFGNYDPSNADFTGYPAVNTDVVCDALAGITPAAAPTPYNPQVSANNRLICQADQLSDTAAYIRTNLGQRYLLGKDVTLSGSFTPIGTITGLFDGGGYTISDLMISSGSVNVGFFGEIGSGATVQNLNFQNPNVSFTGTVEANIGVLAGESSGRIENVNVTGDMARVSGNTSNTMSQSIGGLVGRQMNGTITGAITSGNVSQGGAGEDYMGGLVGGQEENGTIENSTAMGVVSQGGDGNDQMGGLVGTQDGGTIQSSSSAQGNVSKGEAGDDEMGGLVGRQSSGTIENFTVNVDVSDGGPGNDQMGGLVGRQSGSAMIESSTAMGAVSQGGADDDYMGGLVGLQDGGQVENSRAMGVVSQGDDGVDSMGGLVGRQESGPITSSTASGEVRNGGVGDDEMGGLVGGQDGGTIENSTAMGVVSQGGDGNDQMGGLVGTQDGGTIQSNSSAQANVSKGEAGDDEMGGLVGRQSSGTIENFTVNVDVSDGGPGNDQMGGLVGRQSGSAMIESSTAMGAVSQGGDENDRMGGLVGWQENGTIANSIASGDVSQGGGETGVFAGDNMGGLVGRQENGTVTNSIASGDVSQGGDEMGVFAGDNMGGLVGWQEEGMITNSMASGDVSQGGDETGSTAGDRMAGLIGWQQRGRITNSIASGDVSDGGDGDDEMGGLFGNANGSSGNQNFLSLGSVSDGGAGTDQLGGVVGNLGTGASTNLYWNTETSGLETGVGVTGGGALCSNCISRTTTGTNGLIDATSLTGLNTPTSMPTAGPWGFGTTSQYPGLRFTSGDQTCTLRPVLTSAASTSTTTAAEFQICPDAVDEDSFHPTCRSKPTDCPD